MACVYITGDIHGDPMRLSNEKFPEQKQFVGGQDENFVIITGDFGLIWDQLCESKRERYLLNWLEQRPFTTLWVDGNHENYDRIYSSEYPVEEWHGGKVQKIRPHVIHLMRGECYNILGKKFFTFGGASSHDIRDGILEPDDKETIKEWSRSYYKMFRVNHVSWWRQEIASETEMQHGRETLAEHGNTVDFIITHCLPQQVCYMISGGFYAPDVMTMYFDELAVSAKFERWICGHYHEDMRVMGKFDIMYNNIMRIV